MDEETGKYLTRGPTATNLGYDKLPWWLTCAYAHHLIGTHSYRHAVTKDRLMER